MKKIETLEPNKYYYLKIKNMGIQIDCLKVKILPDSTFENAEFEKYSYTEIEEILEPCDYEQLKHIKEMARGAIKLSIETLRDKETLLKTNHLLEKENKKLAYNIGNLGYKIKNQRQEINNRLSEINKLKELLKECAAYISDVDTDKDSLLLTNIEEVL